MAQPSGEAGFAEDLDHLEARLPEAEPAPDLVLDLAGVEHLNSAALARLLKLRRAVTQRGRRLRLTGPSDAVWALFLSTGLDKVFEFAHDTPTALAELQMEP